MGSPKTQTVTQKTEIDPILEGYLTSGQLPEEKLASLRRINEQVYGYAPGTLTPVQSAAAPMPPGGMFRSNLFGDSPMQERQQEAATQSYIDSVNRGRMDRDIVDSGGFGYNSDTGTEMQAGGRDLSMRSGGMYAMGGVVGLPAGGMRPPMMGGGMPNLSNQDMAYQMAMQAMRPRPYAMGGYVEGPGTGTSDSIPAKIYQDGQPVQEAALSDGEFVMTERAVRGAGGGDPQAGAARMYEMMQKFERGGRVG